MVQTSAGREEQDLYDLDLKNLEEVLFCCLLWKMLI